MPQAFKKAILFLRQEKKWWLIPLLMTILILAALVLFVQVQAPLSPFLYPKR
jgi:hypothetical protein